MPGPAGIVLSAKHKAAILAATEKDGRFMFFFWALRATKMIVSSNRCRKRL
jgi:hypothetical protein